MERSELATRIAEVALLHGSFTLRSGRTSSYYLDKYLFSTRPELLREVGRLLAGRIDMSQTDRLAGAELGGIPLVTVAALETGLPTLFVRNQKKDYGTAKRFEGVLNKGDRVVFIEDVATTAGQAIEAARDLTDAGAVIVKIVAVIDREEGAAENARAAGVTFEALFTKTDLGIRD
ncbi:MAG: orotate phosphoribosyltransferase [Phycisphaerales bacterium]|nr:orotate phosphoribosyltransferase [Phycisphaerales bacterium]